MNSLKRIFFTLKTQLDNVADDFENHEAVAQAAIQELEAYRSKTLIHQHRLHQMIEQYETKRADLHQQAESWSARAVKLKGQNEQKALECVKRMLQTKQHIKELEPQLSKARDQFGQLDKDLTDIQAQLQALHTQKEVLSARQNRIQLQSSMSTGTANPTTGAQAIFKRWEQSVAGAELTGPLPPVKDRFAEEFEQEESEQELKHILEELVSKQQD